MSLYAGEYDEAVFDIDSKLVKSTTFRVYTDEDLTELATVYTDADRTSTAVQPLTTSASGMLHFYADPGVYYVRVSSGPGKKVLVREANEDTVDVSEFEAHMLAFVDVHGIPDTSVLENIDGSQAKADAAESNAKNYTDLLLGATNQSSAWLIGNVPALCYESATYNSNGAITSANVVWPDGVEGVFTADELSSEFLGEIDGYHITYLSNPVKTVTQPTVTRDENGNITEQPPLEVT